MTLSSTKVQGYGPKPATIMVVGEAPGAEEDYKGVPFSGESGQLLTLMLHEAGINRASVRVTNVCKYRPPGNEIELWLTSVAGKGKAAGFTPMHGGMWAAPQVVEGYTELAQEIAETSPTLIIALGNTALWALTENTSIMSWRGSVLEGRGPALGRKVVPTYHPAAVLRQWSWRSIVVHDLRRAAGESLTPEVNYPAWNFEIRPTFQSVMERLWDLNARASTGKILPLAVDIETIRHEIACVAIAWSKLDAICIPFRTSREYWTEEEELAIVSALRQLLLNLNVRLIWQNGAYDTQYMAVRWKFLPKIHEDTMIQQHVAYAGMQKSLDFISSMYCDFYQYWKDDLKDYKSAPADDGKFFTYNCRDTVYTFECHTALANVLETLKLTEQYRFQVDHLMPTLMRAMLRGVVVDRRYRDQLLLELMDAARIREIFITDVVGYPLNPKSPKQMAHFLYEELGLAPIKHRKTKKVTANVDALIELSKKFPLISPIADAIIEQRSIGTTIATFVQAEIGWDGRMHTSYNIAGTETYRLSSSTDVFGSGLNLQNVSTGNRQKTRFRMPNIRKLFLPDVGYELADIDQAGADAQVVAWEAGDEKLKQAFREGLKIHAVNSKDLFGRDAGPDGKAEPYYTRTKMGVHLTNYGGKPRTMAGALGITVHEAEKFQNRWFSIHPEIRKWHERIERELSTRRMVVNAFGFRRFYFDRIEQLLPQALAWIPQSTVAIVTNKAMCNMDENLPEVRIMFQVHDSIVFQYPINRRPDLWDDINRLTRIVVPYPDPLVIPWGVKKSQRSWGHCG